MMNKGALCVAALCGALLAVPGTASAESTDVQLLVNETWVQSDEAAGQVYINDAGRTMMPLRVVGDALAYDTDWQTGGSIHITDDSGRVDVTLQIGSTDYTANGVSGSLETAPTLKNDRAYLPARDFAELYGHIYWDNASRTVWVRDSAATDYRIIGNSLLRGNEAGIVPVTMPEGCEVSASAKPDQVSVQRVIDGVGYVAINYNFNHSTLSTLFRDDGGQMTRLTTIIGSSSFWVDGNTIYHTDGTNQGPWSGDIVPNRLYVTTLEGDVTNTAVYTLDFAVNGCTLSMEEGVLVAVDAENNTHTVDLSTLTPDSTFSSAE